MTDLLRCLLWQWVTWGGPAIGAGGRAWRIWLQHDLSAQIVSDSKPVPSTTSALNCCLTAGWRCLRWLNCLYFHQAFLPSRCFWEWFETESVTSFVATILGWEPGEPQLFDWIKEFSKYLMLVKQVHVQLRDSSFLQEGRQISVHPKIVDNEDMCLMRNISQHFWNQHIWN